MTKTSFFSNNRLSAIYTGLGFLFLYGGAVWAKQVELQWIGIGLCAFFLITALYFVTKEYDKEYDQINRL